MVVTALDGQEAERPTEARRPQDLAPTSPGGDPGSSTDHPHVFTQTPQPVFSLAQTQLWSLGPL